MDGTVLHSRYAVELARACGKEDEIQDILAVNDVDARKNSDYASMLARTKKIAHSFRFVHKKLFEETAKSVLLRESVVAFVKEMRRRGFMVGVITDSYFIAAEIVRRRIFADFALGHTLSFENDVCTGQIQLNQAFLSSQDGQKQVCKSNVLAQMLGEVFSSDADEVWAVGDNANDFELLKCSNRGFLIDPKIQIPVLPPHITKIESFRDILELLDLESRAAALTFAKTGILSYQGGTER